MVTTVRMYGIKNCDTIKKARAWMALHHVPYEFHDYKSDGIDEGRLAAWCAVHGWDTVLNRTGTTFKKLTDRDKAGLTEQKAIALMLEQPSMIKRPVLEIGQRTIVGFTADRYAAEFSTR